MVSTNYCGLQQISYASNDQPLQSLSEKMRSKKGTVRQKESSQKTEDPEWLTMKKFEAETTSLEKVSRVANYVIFGASAYGIYSLLAGPGGMLSYASWVAMGLVARKITSTMIGYLVYPAAITSFPYCGGNAIKEIGKQQVYQLVNENFIVKEISLYKSGIKYAAMCISHPNTRKNGNWTIHALGNGMFMEGVIKDLAEKNFMNNCNTLLVNGPSVGSSGGWPTRYQMRAGYEAGIEFLETKIKATHIIMSGFSLGGGMMAEAILNHNFQKGLNQQIRYLAISDRTFDRLSRIAAAFVGRIVEPIFFITGTELNGVGAAEKLSELNIRQIVIQHTSLSRQGDDSVIPDSVSLACTLREDTTLCNKIFLESPRVHHNQPLPRNINEVLQENIQDFLKT
jgi:hypothetical protein